MQDSADRSLPEEETVNVNVACSDPNKWDTHPEEELCRIGPHWHHFSLEKSDLFFFL